MSQIRHQGCDISKYQGGNVDFNSLKADGFDTVIIECGFGNTVLDGNVSEQYHEINHKRALDAGLKVGFYFWVYSNANPQYQAEQFCNLLMNNKVDCKFVLDVEGGSIIDDEMYNNMSMDEITESIIIHMKNIFKENDIILTDNDFVIYSSRSFAGTYLPQSIRKYNYWVAAPTSGDGYMPDTDEPTDMPIEKWVGWQWNQGATISNIDSISTVDLDVFLDDMYLSQPITLGVTKGYNTNPNIKPGDYVKIVDNTLRFAPDLIPQSDKDKKFIIKSIDGDNILLNGLSEWVNCNDLALYEQPVNNQGSSDKNSNLNTRWDDLDFYTKLGLFIGTSEGFMEYSSNGEIGYSSPTSYCNYSQPISPMEALYVAIDFVKANIECWEQSLRNGGCNPDEFNENQLLAIYDYAYNGTPDDIYQFAQQISSLGRIDNIPASIFNVHTDPGTTNHQGLAERRWREWMTYNSNNVYFGGALEAVPAEYSNIINSMYLQPHYTYPFI